MDPYLLRISTINFNNILSILQAFNEINNNKIYEKPESEIQLESQIQTSIQNQSNKNIGNNSNKNLRNIFLEISEELESAKIINRYNSLTNLLFLFIKDPNFNFMLSNKLEENFEIKFIISAFNYGILYDLIKNLSFFLKKFTEYHK
jgi:hypothetical protein